ncbi:hypothetical protein ACFC08_18770 [Streptomyces sp. NPDC056112]|uniref:hypothetical protein n=1 Tax=unclassified Streptomyces TaxID=2593676 RepID=UPI001144BE4F|nr:MULTISPECIES: hypothetical protein [unclassified Streptomyces]
MTDNERPITRDDYERVCILLHAYRIRDLDDSELLWELLHRMHEDRNRRLVDLDNLVGDEGVARETHHAVLVMEALARGKSTIPALERAPLIVCGTPGCPEYTYGALCPACELKLMGSD